MTERLSTPAGAYADAISQTRRVFVRDMEVMASIGIFEHEKRYEQRVFVTVDLKVADDYDGVSDAVDDVLDYGTVVRAVHRIVDDGHINLIETLAQRVADACLDDKRVLAARILIEKPDAFTCARSVGIEIERTAPQRVASALAVAATG
ncbi:MAG: dihydroneopterin aldolase [Pseudomonadota bacterium]